MDKDTTSTTPKTRFDAGTAVFGFAANDAVVQGCIAPGSAVVQGDGRHITADFLAQNAIGHVIVALFPQSPLGQNDAISVIEALAALRYLGEVVVLAPPLLRPKMVELELRSIARGIHVRLMAGALPPLSQI